MSDAEDYGFDLSKATIAQKEAVRSFFQDAVLAGHTPMRECPSCVSAVQHILNSTRSN